MEKIVFGNTVLKGTNKQGVLKPDEHGYYVLALGALGIDNSIGEHYSDNPEVRKVFQDNSILMRRISAGRLRGEYEHPNPADYPSAMVFEKRIRQINSDRVSHHICEVFLETVEYRGKNVLGIFGKVKPSGPYGEVVGESIENPKEDVTFSGRYWSHLKRMNGKLYRDIHTVGTWDYVSEPGVDSSSKYASPTLESIGDMVFHEDQLAEAAEKEAAATESSMESGLLLSSQDILDSFGRPAKTTKGLSKSMQW